jgi:hypothetical protein
LAAAHQLPQQVAALKAGTWRLDALRTPHYSLTGG